MCCRRGCRRAVAAKVCAPSASTSIPTKDVQSLLQEERKTVTQQLRDRGKIVGKLSKKVRGASTFLPDDIMILSRHARLAVAISI